MKKTVLLVAVGFFVLATSDLFIATVQPQGALPQSSAENNRPVIVAGAVMVPSRIVLRRSVRLSESLAVAGGLTKNAKGIVQLIHADGTFNTFRRRNIKGDDIKTNPYLKFGDVVSVF